MATIEERAHDYGCKKAGGHYVGGFRGSLYQACKDTYLEIATEQLAIDIEKACDLFADCMNDAVKNGVLSSDFARNNIETFRKYLTEQNG